MGFRLQRLWRNTSMMSGFAWNVLKEVMMARSFSALTGQFPLRTAQHRSPVRLLTYAAMAGNPEIILAWCDCLTRRSRK